MKHTKDHSSSDGRHRGDDELHAFTIALGISDTSAIWRSSTDSATVMSLPALSYPVPDERHDPASSQYTDKDISDARSTGSLYLWVEEDFVRQQLEEAR